MVIGRLIGSIWATNKYEELDGMKLMRVEVLTGIDAGRQIVCIDTISAGMGERVLVTTGSSAYQFVKERFHRCVPVDAVIVGIIDEDVSL